MHRLTLQRRQQTKNPCRIVVVCHSCILFLEALKARYHLVAQGYKQVMNKREGNLSVCFRLGQHFLCTRVCWLACMQHFMFA